MIPERPTLHDFGNGPVPAHQHPNGDGWVAETATVDASAYIGPSAEVFGAARVSGRAWVFGRARVSGRAQVSGEARVSREAQVGVTLAGYPLEGVPVVPDLDRRLAAAVTDPDALKMRDWHTCETVHCRAGWAICLAGEAGAALERHVGPWLAGALIYVASTGRREVPDFFAPHDAALADIQARAEQGGAS